MKGLKDLAEAWRSLGTERKDWEIVFIGDGPLKPILLKLEQAKTLSFMQPKELASEIEQAGCLILPSRTEPWGVVVHEFASAGLPLILSDKVGAGASFLIQGYNGYTFKAGNLKSLKNSMRKIIFSSDEELLMMSEKISQYLKKN